MILKLILQDDIETTTCQIDKSVLINKCKYFEMMFSGFKEKDSQEITMKVPYACVIHDIIVSFSDVARVNKYEMSEFEYQLKRLICCDFLILPWNFNYFAKNGITKNDFDTFLDVLDVIGYSDEAIQIIIRDIPENYNLKRFSKKLLQRMQKLDNNFRVVFVKEGEEIKTWNSVDNKLTTSNIIIGSWTFFSSPYIKYDVGKMYPFLEISSNGKIITKSDDQVIITDIFSQETTRIKYDHKIKQLIFSQNAIYDGKKFQILEQGISKYSIKIKEDFVHSGSHFALTPDRTRIVSNNGCICNADTGELIEINKNIERETNKMVCIRSELWVKIDELLAN